MPVLTRMDAPSDAVLRGIWDDGFVDLLRLSPLANYDDPAWYPDRIFVHNAT